MIHFAPRTVSQTAINITVSTMTNLQGRSPPLIHINVRCDALVMIVAAHKRSQIMRVRKLSLSAAFLLGTLIMGATSAAAAPLSGGWAVSLSTDLQQESLVTLAQGRRGVGRGGARRGGVRRGGRRGGGIGSGGAAAIGIIGAIGTMMAIDAARQQTEASDAIAYCMRRFRSYNPETGYYLGFDGRYHRCP